jgi:hypothetical protein
VKHQQAHHRDRHLVQRANQGVDGGGRLRGKGYGGRGIRGGKEIDVFPWSA